MIKIINISFVSTSPNTKMQDSKSKAAAEKLAAEIPEIFTCIFKINDLLYWAKVPKSRILERYRVSGSRAKILTPLSKKQVITLINNGTLEKIGVYTDLKKYYNGNYSVSNDGQAVEYLVAQKSHTKFTHTGKMSTAGEFRNTEVKFFDFDKTTGTPSATCKAI